MLGQIVQSRQAQFRLACELDEMKEAAERRWVWVGDVRSLSKDVRWAQIGKDEDVDESELEEVVPEPDAALSLRRVFRPRLPATYWQCQ